MTGVILVSIVALVVLLFLGSVISDISYNSGLKDGIDLMAEELCRIVEKEEDDEQAEDI